MSIGIRVTASTLPSATATTSTITVSGRRMAKTIGFMGSVRSGDRVRRSSPFRLLGDGPSAQSGQSALGSKFMMRDAGSVGICGRR